MPQTETPARPITLYTPKKHSFLYLLNNQTLFGLIPDDIIIEIFKYVNIDINYDMTPYGLQIKSVPKGISTYGVYDDEGDYDGSHWKSGERVLSYSTRNPHNLTLPKGYDKLKFVYRTEKKWTYDSSYPCVGDPNFRHCGNCHQPSRHIQIEYKESFKRLKKIREWWIEYKRKKFFKKTLFKQYDKKQRRRKLILNQSIINGENNHFRFHNKMFPWSKVDERFTTTYQRKSLYSFQEVCPYRISRMYVLKRVFENAESDNEKMYCLLESSRLIRTNKESFDRPSDRSKEYHWLGTDYSDTNRLRYNDDFDSLQRIYTYLYYSDIKCRWDCYSLNFKRQLKRYEKYSGDYCIDCP